MDPFLEHPALWSSVHHRLIGEIDDVLTGAVGPRYYVSIEEDFYIVDTETTSFSGRADALISVENGRGANGRHGGVAAPAVRRDQPGVLTVELPAPSQERHRYLEVRHAGTHEVVTVVDVLSPTNKKPGRGRRQYETKRNAIANSFANLIEIDLLREYTPLPILQDGQAVPDAALGDYRLLVSRSEDRPLADLYIVSVRQPLPVISIPLRAGDAEPQLDLQAIVHAVYAHGYEKRIDYSADPEPPLRGEDRAWANDLLRAIGLR
jgi:hypothetical protein